MVIHSVIPITFCNGKTRGFRVVKEGDKRSHTMILCSAGAVCILIVVDIQTYSLWSCEELRLVSGIASKATAWMWEWSHMGTSSHSGCCNSDPFSCWQTGESNGKIGNHPGAWALYHSCGRPSWNSGSWFPLDPAPAERVYIFILYTLIYIYIIISLPFCFR